MRMLNLRRFLLSLWALMPVVSYVSADQAQPPARVLVYTATAGFRHDSIPTAIQALKNRSSSINVVFDNTEDQTRFNDQTLAKYDAVMFLHNTGEVLDDAGKTALQNYLNLGGNFVGIHSCSDALINTTFFGKEIGAFFDYHPDLQNATVDVLDASHPSTSMLPAQWHIREEMYNFKSDPRSIGAKVLLSANESSYVDTGVRKFDQGTPHPSAWFQEHGAGVEAGHLAGRSFYTSLGHLNETWQDPLFMAHVTGGLTWALQANTTRAFNSTALVGNAEASLSSSLTSSSTASTPAPSQPSSAIATVRVSVAAALLLIVGAAILIF